MAASATQASRRDSMFAEQVARYVTDAGFNYSPIKSYPDSMLVSVADGQSIGIVCSPTTDRERDAVDAIYKFISVRQRVLKVVLVRTAPSNSQFRERLRKSFDVDVVALSDIGEYLREWREVFEDEEYERSPFGARIVREVLRFGELVQTKVRGIGFEVVSQAKYWFVASLGSSWSTSVVPAEHLSRDMVSRAVRRAKARSSMRGAGVVVVMAKPLTDRKRSELSKLYQASVISLSEVEQYFGAVKPQKKGELQVRVKAKASRSTRIKANADVLIFMVRSLALQIDAKLEALHNDRPNDPDAVQIRADAIKEYTELRRKVGALERAVAGLKQPKAKTTPITEAGKAFGAFFERWWQKSGPRVVDKSADMGLVMSSAGIMALMGINPAVAAGIAALVVTGKSVTGVFKASSGH